MRAAQRLHGWSVALAALLSLVSVGGVVAGFAVAVGAHSGKRAAGGLGIVFAALLFETGALVMCFLCQAIARHIEREAR